MKKSCIFGLFAVCFAGQSGWAQTFITNFTSSITHTVASDGWSRNRPELDVSTVGTTNFLVLCYRQWRNGELTFTNNFSGNLSPVGKGWASIPNGGMYIFRINSSSNLSCVYTNTNGHSHYAGGAINSPNKVWFYQASPAVLTNVCTNYSVSPYRLETNVVTDYWGGSISGMLTTTNQGTNWTTSLTPGSSTPGFIVEGGNAAQSTNYSFVVIVSTNSSKKVVFGIHRVP